MSGSVKSQLAAYLFVVNNYLVENPFALPFL
jgi:hypothetical protein